MLHDSKVGPRWYGNQVFSVPHRRARKVADLLGRGGRFRGGFSVPRRWGVRLPPASATGRLVSNPCGVAGGERGPPANPRTSRVTSRVPRETAVVERRRIDL